MLLRVSRPAAWGGTGLGASPIAGRGRSDFLGFYLDAHVSGASIGVHGIESTWVPAVKVAQVAVNWLWIYSGLLRSRSCGATKLVGYVHQKSGKCLLVPPPGVNIVVSAVHHDNPPFGDSHLCPFLCLA